MPLRAALLLAAPLLGGSLLGTLLLGTSLLATGARAQPTGLSYSVSPVGVAVRFDPNAGLGSGLLYGGRLGVGFGRSLELDGEYLRSSGVRTDLSRIDAPSGVDVLLGTLPDREVEIERTGATLRATVGRSRLLPFLSVGTGVLRIVPEDADDTRSIYATYGAGVTLAFGARATLTLAGSRFAYRYSPVATFALGDEGLAPESLPLRTVYNNALAAAARVSLGGQPSGVETDVDRAFAQRLRVFVEPAYGTVDFSDRLGPTFPDQQPLAGVSVGIDLGRYVGLRASVLRATDEATPFDDGVPRAFRDLTLVGGELNLRFATGSGDGGATPYLIGGGGYLRAGDGYAPQGAAGPPESRYFAQGGAGLDVAIARTVRLKGAARALLMSDLDEGAVASPGRVYASPLYTAGVEFSLGGGRPPSTDGRDIDALLAAERRRLADERAAGDGARDAEARAVQARLSAEIAALRRQLDATSDAGARAALSTEIAVRERVATETARIAPPAPSAPADRAGAPRRTIEVPVPETGEIYIRYGDPVAAAPATAPVVIGTVPGMASAPGPGPGGGAVTAEQIAALVRAELDRRDGQALTRADVDRVVRDVLRASSGASEALGARLAAIEARLGVAQPAQIVVLDSSGVRRVVAVPSSVAGPGAAAAVEAPAGLLGGRRLVALFPVVGVRTGGAAAQGLIGLRGDFRAPSGLGMRLLPDVLVGVGDGLSVQAFGNVAWALPSAVGVLPYAGGGVGLKTDAGVRGAGLALNLLLGAELGLGVGDGFVEASTLDFFDVNRLLVGYRIRF